MSVVEEPTPVTPFWQEVEQDLNDVQFDIDRLSEQLKLARKRNNTKKVEILESQKAKFVLRLREQLADLDNLDI